MPSPTRTSTPTHRAKVLGRIARLIRPVVIGVCLAVAATSPGFAAAVQAEGVGIEQRLNNQVPLDLKFRNESGQTVALKSYFGTRPVVLSLVYFGCRMMCTLTEYGLVNALHDARSQLGTQYEVLTVSFDPKDDPSQAAAQKENFAKLYARPGVADGWHFLVGDAASIHALTESVGFEFRYLAQIDQFDHPTGIMVLTPGGRVSRYFYGVQYPAHDLDLALADAAQGLIANPADMERMLNHGYSNSPASACKPGAPPATQKQQ